ncbi:hypothetical protein ACFQU7_01470 [Pseudoroseomonas wenyumeiae]
MTHTHRDHTGGVPTLVAATGAATLGFGPHMTPPGEGARAATMTSTPTTGCWKAAWWKAKAGA